MSTPIEQSNAAEEAASSAQPSTPMEERENGAQGGSSDPMAEKAIGTEPAMSPFEADRETVERLVSGRARIEAELSKVIVGQKEVIEQILIALFAGGHCLITGAQKPSSALHLCPAKFLSP